MPEIVDVSMPSSRTGPASKSSSQACFGPRALTFNSVQLSVRAALEDLFSDSVRRAVLEQTLREPWILFQRLPRPLPSQLPRDLGRLVAQPSLGQLLGAPGRLEVPAVREDRLPELLDAFLACRHGGDDGRLPAPPGRQAEHRPQLCDHARVAVDVRLVDDEDVRDLEDAGLDHLHAVAEVWGQDDDRGVGGRRDLELRLTDTDRLEDHLIETERAEKPDCLARGQRQTPEVAARAHAAYEHFRIEGVALHANAVAQDRAARKGRVGVGRQDRDRPFLLTQQRHHGIDQRRLAGARCAREAGHPWRASLGAKRCFEVAYRRVAALDEGDRPGQGAHVAGEELLQQSWVGTVFTRPTSVGRSRVREPQPTHRFAARPRAPGWLASPPRPFRRRSPAATWS